MVPTSAKYGLQAPPVLQDSRPSDDQMDGAGRVAGKRRRNFGRSMDRSMVTENFQQLDFPAGWWSSSAASDVESEECGGSNTSGTELSLNWVDIHEMGTKV